MPAKVKVAVEADAPAEPPREPKFGEKGFGLGRKRKPRSDRKPRDPSKPRRAVGRPSLARNLEDMVTQLGVMVAAADQTCGLAIIGGASNLAVALDRLAKQNPKVKAALERFVAGTAWSGVVTATAAILIPVAAHHGILPRRIADMLPVEEAVVSEPEVEADATAAVA